MKKNVLFSIFGFGVILISIFMLSGSRPAVVEAKAGSEPAQAGIVYAIDSISLKLFNAAERSPSYMAADVDPADRKFSGAYYQGRQGNEILVSADTARWIALGERYLEAQGFNQRRADAGVARWVAMGQAYARLAASQSKPFAGAVDLNDVDPADRKFFTANHLGLKGDNLLASVDPADRKFFADS